MQSKRITWPRVLFAGCAAFLIATVGFAAERAPGMTDEEYEYLQSIDKVQVPPKNVVPAGSFTGEPDLRPLRHNRSLRAMNPHVPFAEPQGIWNHPIPPRTEVCGRYHKQSSFETQHNPTGTELSFEDHELGSNNGSGYMYCHSWIDKDGLTPCFRPGTIVPGITLREYPTRGNYAQLHTGKGFQGAPSKGVGPNYFVDGYHYYFNDPRGVGNSMAVSAFGGDLTSIYGSGEAEEVVTITLETGEQFQFRQTGKAKGVFMGVCCDVLIEEVDVWIGGSSGFEYVDNMQFGDYGICTGDPPPITWNDIHDGLDILELKLDELTGGGGNGGGTTSLNFRGSR